MASDNKYYMSLIQHASFIALCQVSPCIHKTIFYTTYKKAYLISIHLMYNKSLYGSRADSSASILANEALVDL